MASFDSRQWRGALLMCALLATLTPWLARAQNGPIAEGAPLIDFVEAGKPEWNFARTMDHDSCWPQYAFLPPDGRPNPGVDIRAWPKTNEENCPKTGDNFPTYYVAQKCNDAEIRVLYTLYIPNSGFDTGPIQTNGHRHDFEGIVLVWRRDGDAWTRSYMLMSQHKKQVRREWRDAESWYLDWSSAGLGRAHPRIFVGWGSHAMFNDQKTTYSNIASTAGGNEYRNAHYPQHGYELVEVTEDNDVGQRFQAALDAGELGGAGKEGNPLLRLRELCSLAA